MLFAVLTISQVYLLNDVGHQSRKAKSVLLTELSGNDNDNARVPSLNFKFTKLALRQSLEHLARYVCLWPQDEGVHKFALSHGIW